METGVLVEMTELAGLILPSGLLLRMVAAVAAADAAVAIALERPAFRAVPAAAAGGRHLALFLAEAATRHQFLHRKGTQGAMVEKVLRIPAAAVVALWGQEMLARPPGHLPLVAGVALAAYLR